MLRLRSYLIALTLLTLFLGIDSAYAGSKGPIMFIKDASHDFGTVEQGSVNKHIFKFENKGDEVLKIVNVKPSCGCTAALLTSDELPPGQKGEMEVTFNAGKFKGKVKKYVTIETNEEPTINKITPPGAGPKRPQDIKEPTKIHKLYLQANVKYDKKKEAALKRAREAAMRRSKAAKKVSAKKPVQAPAAVDVAGPSIVDYYPKTVSFGDIKINQDYKKIIKFKNLSREAAMIEKVTVTAPFTSAMITKVQIAPDRPGEVSITANVQQAGEVKDAKVNVYIVGDVAPIEIPLSWNAK